MIAKERVQASPGAACSCDTVLVPTTEPAPVSLDDRLRELEISLIDWALKVRGGNKSKAADLLTIKRSTLGDRINRCGLNPAVKTNDCHRPLWPDSFFRLVLDPRAGGRACLPDQDFVLRDLCASRVGDCGEARKLRHDHPLAANSNNALPLPGAQQATDSKERRAAHFCNFLA